MARVAAAGYPDRVGPTRAGTTLFAAGDERPHPMTLQDVFEGSLELPLLAGAFRLGQTLAHHFADQAVLPVEHWAFTPHEFAGAGRCSLDLDDRPGSLVPLTWRGGRLRSDPRIGMYRVGWDDHALWLVEAAWPVGTCTTPLRWVIADSARCARGFVETVCRWSTRIERALLVFDRGHFRPCAELARHLCAVSTRLHGLAALGLRRFTA